MHGFAFPAPRTVQTDAHTASKEEEQTQAQTPSTTGPITTRYGIHTKSYIYRDVMNLKCFQATDLRLFNFIETPSDSDPKKKKKKRDDDPDRKKKKKDKKKKKVSRSIKTTVNHICVFLVPNTVISRDRWPSKTLVHSKPILQLCLKRFISHKEFNQIWEYFYF